MRFLFAITFNSSSTVLIGTRRVPLLSSLEGGEKNTPLRPLLDKVHGKKRQEAVDMGDVHQIMVVSWASFD